MSAIVLNASMMSFQMQSERGLCVHCERKRFGGHQISLHFGAGAPGDLLPRSLAQKRKSREVVQVLCFGRIVSGRPV